MNKSTKNFLGAIGVIWILLGALHAWGRVEPSKKIAVEDSSETVKSASIEKVAIPMVAEKDDRSPGIRVDSMPFKSVDLTTLWAMQCQDQFIELFLDVDMSELFALIDKDAVFPDKMVCHLFGAQNNRHSAVFDLKRARFVVQNTPEHKPI